MKQTYLGLLLLGLMTTSATTILAPPKPKAGSAPRRGWSWSCCGATTVDVAERAAEIALTSIATGATLSIEDLLTALALSLTRCIASTTRGSGISGTAPEGRNALLERNILTTINNLRTHFGISTTQLTALTEEEEAKIIDEKAAGITESINALAQKIVDSNNEGTAFLSASLHSITQTPESDHSISRMTVRLAAQLLTEITTRSAAALVRPPAPTSASATA
jgi:hypothetical protein